MTFHQKELAPVLKRRFVESRLHMDGDDRVPAALLAAHRLLQKELIGNLAVPHYAILDPFTGDFLYRTHLRGGDLTKWRDDFAHLFAQLPDLPIEK